MFAFVSKDDFVIIVLGVIILFLFILFIIKNIKKIQTSEKVEKKIKYECEIIAKREYINKDNEVYYYLTFSIDDEERELLVPKKYYLSLAEGMKGTLTLLKDKVFLNFLLK